MVPLLIRHRWSLAFGHKWSHCNRAYMSIGFGHRGSFPIQAQSCFAFGHRWSHCIRTYKFVLDPGTDGPFRNQAQMVLVHLGTDVPIAFVHTSSYGNHTQIAPCLVGHRWALFRHRWSCCIWAQMVPLHSCIHVPMGSGHRWSLP